MQDDDRPDGLADLNARIEAARARRDGPAGPKTPVDASNGTMLGFAMRAGVELVAAVGVSTGVGWLADRWLQTRPWLTVVFFFFGGAAGMLNVWRATRGYGLAAGYKKPDRAEREGTHEQ